MTDSKLLREAIEKSGYKLRYLAERLRLSTYGLQLKIDGRNEFKATEIAALSEILKLPNSDRDRIFFASDVDKTPT